MNPDDILHKALDADSSVRAATMLELGHLKTSFAIAALVRALRDPDASVRCNAGCALAESGPLANSAVTSLLESLADAEPDVRAASAQALGAIGVKGAVSALLGSADDADWFVRAEVAEALARLAPGDPSARATIRTLLTDPRVRKMSPTARQEFRHSAAPRED